MKKFILLFTLLIVGFAMAEAQSNQETIYLKNGSIVKGIILKQDANGKISMSTSDGNFVVFNKEEIDKVVYGANNSVRKHYSLIQKNQHRLNLYHTYRGFVDTGLAFDLSDSDGYFSCSTSHGYQFNPHLFLGGGFAINYYFDASEAVIPVFADLRYYITKHRITPYIGTKLGYSISKYGDEYAELAVGVRFKIAQKLGLNCSLAYAYQNVDFEDYFDDNDTSNNTLKITFGLEF